MGTFAAYLELMRFGNPIGALMVYFPYLHGSLFALAAPSELRSGKLEGFLSTNAILLPASIMLHSAACSWNDIVDSDIDKKVSRTRSRPIPRGAISLRNAYIFTFLEFVVWLGLCRWISPQTLAWSFPLLPMSVIYPYSKRFTNYTTLFVSPIIAWAIYIGSVAQGADPSPTTTLFWGLTFMFLAECIHHNTVETIYAHQDLKDDLKLGVASMAVRFRSNPKRALAVFALIEMVFRIAMGILMEFGGFYYVVVVLGTTIVNTWMIASVDLADPSQCWFWFQGGGLMVGTILTGGMLFQLWR
ncbi:UbiA prenyltransferase family [Bisporella sp. PMI_857]|nr:UbiA prenyltransferase family [Bisporella sp. PMI_857]